MNSLEFIKQNIFELKNHIEHLEIKIIEDKKYPSFVKCHKERIEELKPILNILQQIKAELEAWEVVKDKISITVYYDNEQDYEEDINSHNAICLNSKLKLQNSNNEEEWFVPLTDEESEKFKKALEKENVKDKR